MLREPALKGVLVIAVLAGMLALSAPVLLPAVGWLLDLL